MKRKIFVHVGSEKTGSTSLQSIFVKNRKLFKSHGVYYPESGVKSDHHYWFANALGFRNTPRPVSFKNEKQALIKMKEELASVDENILISSEFFDIGADNLTAKNLKLYFGDDFEVVVILYVRNQVDYVQSLYAESLKWGGTHTYKQFIDIANKKNKLDNLYRYKTWVDSGVDGLVVLSYDQVRQDLLGSFLDTLNLSDLDQDGIKGNELNQNVTPSFQFLEDVRCSSLDLPRPERRDNYLKMYKEWLKSDEGAVFSGKEKLVVPPAFDGIFAAHEMNNLLLEKIVVGTMSGTWLSSLRSEVADRKKGLALFKEQEKKV